MICLWCEGEENSRVQAHIDGEEFSAHIQTDEAEYNVEVRTKDAASDDAQVIEERHRRTVSWPRKC